MSNIDPTVPVYGTPTTQSVRDNFATAKSEIEALQANSATAAQLAAYLPLAGGTMSGLLTLSGAPTANLHPASKQYVDSNIAAVTQGAATLYLPLAGGHMTGSLLLAHDATQPLEAVTLEQLQAASTGGGGGGASISISDTPPASPATGALWWDSISGQLYLWYTDANSSQWVIANNLPTGAGSFLPLTGGTLTGALVLPGNATASLQATPLQQVQSIAAAAVAPAAAAAFNGIGRNLLHNPLFNVAQRGAGAWTVSGAYTLDRWIMWLTLDALNVSRNILGDAARAQIGDEAATSGMAVGVTGNAAATSLSLIEQRIEDVRRLGGKTVTLSFWAVGSAALKIGVTLQQWFGNGGAPSAPVNSPAQVITVGTTWARYSLTFSLPSTVGKTLGTAGDFTAVDLWLSAGANNTAIAGVPVQVGSFTFWGVQLEIGSVATPLEKPDPQQDLAKCQRFYQTGGYSFSSYGTTGMSPSSTGPFPVQFRAAPTFTAARSNANIGGPSEAASADHYFVAGTVTATGGYNLSASFTASADL